MSATLVESLGSFVELDGILLDCSQRVVNADYTDELAESQQSIAEYEAKMFGGEFDANLDTWARLAKSTIKKKGHDQILVETGALRDSLVSVAGPGNVHEIMSRQMRFGTEVGYAMFHQYGTSRMPARPPVGMSEETLDKLVNSVADAIVGKMKLNV